MARGVQTCSDGEVWPALVVVGCREVEANAGGGGERNWTAHGWGMKEDRQWADGRKEEQRRHSGRGASGRVGVGRRRWRVGTRHPEEIERLALLLAGADASRKNAATRRFRENTDCYYNATR